MPSPRSPQDRVDAALRAVPREAFLRPADRAHAGHDGPLAISCGQTNSQPRTVRDMLVLLQVQPGHRVLDVGAGSGWTTALLTHLAGTTGRVVAVELEPELVAFGQANLDAFARHVAPPGDEAPPRATTRIAQATPGVLGVPEHGPYDRILVSADAGQLPDQLVAQLADGGRLVLPIRGRMTCARKEDDGIECSEHGLYRFVPLRERR